MVEEEEENIFVAARACVLATLERRPLAPATTSMDDGRFGLKIFERKSRRYIEKNDILRKTEMSCQWFT